MPSKLIWSKEEFSQYDSVLGSLHEIWRRDRAKNVSAKLEHQSPHPHHPATAPPPPTPTRPIPTHT